MSITIRALSPGGEHLVQLQFAHQNIGGTGCLALEGSIQYLQLHLLIPCFDNAVLFQLTVVCRQYKGPGPFRVSCFSFFGNCGNNNQYQAQCQNYGSKDMVLFFSLLR